ncbi:DUF7527 domain-containing protein [Halostella litorea]|uniref:DUF7527 domain-containing protein n=1 Tax=Halostella litorea TaxID=2528831 RepID=UPI001091B64C|nr:transcriptional regulator [Halostella litorea]
MNARTEERIGDWRTRTVAAGYEGLRDLADDGFSGAVRARGTTLFMLNGRIVGVFEGAIEDFETADATAHVAPDPSLPLLFTMLEKGGDQRAKYYTEDTPIDEADGTLSSGSFTGYIELSENVLSGDYYVAYYGGKSMSCAFVGNREELITGDEAFKRASDEVGIYEVRDVDIEVTDVPEPDEPDEPAGAGAAAGAEAGTGLANGGTEADTGSAGAGDPTTAAGTGDATAEPTDPTPPSDPSPARSDAADATDEPTATEAARTPADPTPADSAPADTTDPRASEPTTTDATDPQAADTADATEPQPTDAADPTAGVEATGTTPERSTDPSPGERSARSEPRDPATDRESTPADDPAGEPEPKERSPTGGPAEPARDAGPAGVGTDPEPDPSGVDPAHPTESGAVNVDDAVTGGDKPERSEASTAEAADAPAAADGAAATRTDTVEPSDGAAEPDPGLAVEERTAADAAADAADAAARTTETATESSEDSTGPADGGSWDADLGTGGADADAGASGTDAPEPTVTEEREWQEARTIPALDPDRTSTGDDGAAEQSRADDRGRSADSARASGTSRTPDAGGTRREASESPADTGSHAGRDEALKQEVLEREDKIDQLQQAVTNLRSEREELREERDELRAENESLTERVTELEAEIQRLEGEVDRLEGELTEAKRAAGGAPDADRRIGAAEALQGTNLFVRYASKGDATLEDAHAGNADAEEVNANLRLEHHTQFDSGNVAVDGQAFDEFLTGTLEFDFVDWVVGELIYEIRDTGHAGSLEDLYDAIAEIDRAELKGSVSLVYQENGDEVREQKQFDVVLRDRMGNPLIVADLNDSREPVTQSGMASLENSASRVKETNGRLSAAFVVTSSFFEPGALETAAEATSGSFLSRDSKKSFVKLSRKDGYHLCLVEARGTDFHINVPEL